tara:strand:+ start:123 stop:275 length:153 start_codon:yes stop_codon:yes gene_type:complete
MEDKIKHLEEEILRKDKIIYELKQENKLLLKTMIKSKEEILILKSRFDKL